MIEVDTPVEIKPYGLWKKTLPAVAALYRKPAGGIDNRETSLRANATALL